MKKLLVIAVVTLLFLWGLVLGDNILINPSFEEQEPAFWHGYNATLGNELGWESSEVYHGFHSFKISKSSATSTAVGWESVNNANLYWNNAAAGTYSLSAWVKTVGVNTNPATDDEKIWVEFEFRDASGNLLVTEKLYVDQSSADQDWAQLTGATVLTVEPESVVIRLVMGKDATGTVYFDDLGCNTTDSWSMWPFNSGAETIKGWLNWYNENNGSYGIVTDNAAYDGSYSAELYKPDTTSSSSEIVYYSVPVPVEAGAWYKISVWVKTEGVNTDDSFEPTYIRKERLDERIGLCYFFHNDENIDEGWSLTGGDKFVYIDQREANEDWTIYEVAERAPDDATGISVRARFTSYPTGKAWFDMFKVEKMDETGDQLIINNSFEDYKPAFWHGYNATLGNELGWESSEVYHGFHSFKISKSSATSTAVGWESVNNANLYWNNAAAGTYSLSAWVKTVGVNTNPATDDEKIWVEFEFRDASGNLLVTEKLYVDQSSADQDWAQLTGATVLTVEPESVVIRLVMGKDATGTVYFDDVGCNTTDSWSMWPFNSGAETIDGWLNWYNENNGSYGTVTDNQAYDGTYSAEIFKPDTTSSSSEIVYYSIPVPVEAGEWYKVGVWVKTQGVNTDDSFEPTYIRKERLDERLGLCYFFHNDENIDEGWSLTGGDKFVYVDQTVADKDWTYYEVAERAPEDATGISVRARFTSYPTGTAWFDKFEVRKLTVAPSSIDPGQDRLTLPEKYQMVRNFPNPFNPSTTIEYVVPERGNVNLSVYDLLGNRISTLVNEAKPKGLYRVVWNGRNEKGEMVASGVYFYVYTIGERQYTGKMLLIR